MSIAGFNRLQETGRFSTPAGPANREELTGVGDSKTTTVHQSPCPESSLHGKASTRSAGVWIHAGIPS